MSIPLYSPLQNITNSLVVENNGLNFGVSSDVLWIYNMTLRNVQSVGLSKLVAVNNSLEISSCDGLTDVDLESLTLIGGDLYVANNPSLTFVSMPAATSIWGDWLGTPAPTTGGLITSKNNPSMRGVNFGSLRGSGGAHLDGPWPSLAFLNTCFPALNSIPGGIFVVFDDEPGAGQGSAPPVQCNYEQSNAPKTWSSAFSCNGTAPNPKSSYGMSLNAKDRFGAFNTLYCPSIWICAISVTNLRFNHNLESRTKQSGSTSGTATFGAFFEFRGCENAGYLIVERKQQKG